jgi:predicted transcriptional regulator
MPKAYRSKSKLVLDVLRAVRDEGEAQTNRVLLRANLSYARLQGQVADLEEKGWIARTPQAGRKAWTLTPEGARILGTLEKVEDLMRDFGLPL